MKFTVILFYSLLLTAVCFSQQNLKENFLPLKSSGQLPLVFTQNLQNVIRQDVQEMEKSAEVNKNIKANFFYSSNYQIEKIIRSGNTLINDEVSKFLNEITGILLKNDPVLRSKISVYAFKSVVVNAYSFDKGHIFVDLGLVAQAETEAQLAYLLCHEIEHYARNHQINSYVNEELIEKSSEFENKLSERCQYSKELESEADLEGFKLLEKSDYNPKQALTLFNMLQYSHLPFELVEFKKGFFERKGYVIPESYFKKEVSNITDNSNFDDSKMTHPNTAKRRSAVAEKIKFAEKSGKHDYIIGKEKFEYIRDLARMELCRLYLKNRDYPNAFYAAYILKQKYPKNEYIEEIICKSLYAISLYKNNLLNYKYNSYMPGGLPSSSDIEGYPQQLYYFMGNIPSNEIAILSLNYVYRTHQKYPQNQQMALCSDSLLGMMKKIDWGISDFNRTAMVDSAPQDTSDKRISKTDLIAQIQKNSKHEDSIYYKNVFHDLLTTDKYFSEHFPLTAPALTFDNEKKSQKKTVKKGIDTSLSINRVLFLEPFYYNINKKTKQQFKYLEAHLKQETFLRNVTDYATSLGFELVTFDPGILKADEIIKMNDYSVLNDWLFEKLDSDQEKSTIFNTNDIEELTLKYKTRYVLKTGMVCEKTGHRNKIYFLVYVFDIRSNRIVYQKTERFKGKDRKDLVNAKTYQMIYDLKNRKGF